MSRLRPPRTPPVSAAPAASAPSPSPRLLVAACGSPAPSATPERRARPRPRRATATPGTVRRRPRRHAAPERRLAALYREIEDQVHRASAGCPRRSASSRRSSRRTRSRRAIKAQFEKDNPADEIAVAEETLKALGLLPADASLGELYVDLLGSQVAGFYDPETQEMVVVSRSGTIGGDREGHLRPRVHPRPPGPELRPARGSTSTRSARATARSAASRSSRATRRSS